MIKAGILNGDQVSETVNHQKRDIVIAMNEDNEACKRFFKEKDRFRLNRKMIRWTYLSQSVRISSAGSLVYRDNIFKHLKDGKVRNNLLAWHG